MTNLSISIITPSYNRGCYIREAIESVLQQNTDLFEHIIVDALSTDKTMQVLQDYPHLDIIHEEDRGMYDAINKGIHRARGEIIGILNSDDLYAAGAFEAVNKSFQANPKSYAVVGAAAVFVDQRNARKTIRVNPWIEPEKAWEQFTFGIPVTNAWFFRREVFNQLGGFNPAYQFVGDKEFLIRFALSNLDWSTIQRTLYQYRQHPDSATVTPITSQSVERAIRRSSIFGEALQIAEQFLTRNDLPILALKNLRIWHSERSYRVAAMALYHHWWHLAWQTMLRGWRYDWKWPMVFLQKTVSRLVEPD